MRSRDSSAVVNFLVGKRFSNFFHVMWAACSETWKESSIIKKAVFCHALAFLSILLVTCTLWKDTNLGHVCGQSLSRSTSLGASIFLRTHTNAHPYKSQKLTTCLPNAWPYKCVHTPHTTTKIHEMTTCLSNIIPPWNFPSAASSSSSIQHAEPARYK